MTDGQEFPRLAAFSQPTETRQRQSCLSNNDTENVPRLRAPQFPSIRETLATTTTNNQPQQPHHQSPPPSAPLTAAERRAMLRNRLRDQIASRRDHRTSNFAKNLQMDRDDAREEVQEEPSQVVDATNVEENPLADNMRDDNPMIGKNGNNNKKKSQAERKKAKRQEKKMRKAFQTQGVGRKLSSMGMADSPLTRELAALQQSGQLKPHNYQQVAASLMEEHLGVPSTLSGSD